MPNSRGKEVDFTHLSIDHSEKRYLIHRDYIAHCMRWSHAAKTAIAMRGDLWVLDVGCGKEMPLAKALYTNKIGADKYCGVEYNHFEIPDMLQGNGVFPVRLLRGADAAAVTREQVTFEPNLVVMFEVFEHIEPKHGRAVLDNLVRLMRPDGTFLFSTPCFNGNAAGNHVAEPEYEVMGATLEDAGFAIVDHWGTFASIRDYRDELYQQYGDDGFKLFEALKQYYDVNFLASVFAPAFPKQARNCLWHCCLVPEYKLRFGVEYARMFPPRLEVKPKFSPTGSSSTDDDVLDQEMMDALQAKWARLSMLPGATAADVMSVQHGAQPLVYPFNQVRAVVNVGGGDVDLKDFVLIGVDEDDDGTFTYKFKKIVKVAPDAADYSYLQRIMPDALRQAAADFNATKEEVPDGGEDGDGDSSDLGGT